MKHSIITQTSPISQSIQNQSFNGRPIIRYPIFYSRGSALDIYSLKFLQSIFIYFYGLYFYISTVYISIFLQSIFLSFYSLYLYISTVYISIFLQSIFLSFYSLYFYISTVYISIFLQSIFLYFYSLYFYISTVYISIFLQSIFLYFFIISIQNILRTSNIESFKVQSYWTFFRYNCHVAIFIAWIKFRIVWRRDHSGR